MDLRSCQTWVLAELKKSLFPKGGEVDPARHGQWQHPCGTHKRYPACSSSSWPEGGPGSPPGHFGTSPTTDPHPFSAAAEAADPHSSHASQAPSQPATQMNFLVCSGSPTSTLSLKRRKNKLMKHYSMQDALPLTAWLLL